MATAGLEFRSHASQVDLSTSLLMLLHYYLYLITILWCSIDTEVDIFHGCKSTKQVHIVCKMHVTSAVIARSNDVYVCNVTRSRQCKIGEGHVHCKHLQSIYNPVSNPTKLDTWPWSEQDQKSRLWARYELYLYGLGRKF